MRKTGTPCFNTNPNWSEINILKLDTYFVKLMQNKFKTTGHYQQTLEMVDSDESGVNVPSKDDVSDFIRQYEPTNPEISVQTLAQLPNFQILLN